MILSNTYICPFCGEDFDAEGNRHDNIQNVLQKIVGIYGKDVLLDAQRSKALLMDYAPRADKERKLIVTVLQERIAYQLYDLTGKDKSSVDLIIKRCIKQLVSELWMTELAASFAVVSIAKALGVKIENEEELISNSESPGETELTTKDIFTKEFEKKDLNDIQSELQRCDRIGYKAFAAMGNLTEISVPESIKKIYPRAFLNCINLKKIILPASVTEIGNCAFEGCYSLENIVISNSVSFKNSDGLLIDKKKKMTIRMENSSSKRQCSIPNGIEVITKKTFEGPVVEKIVVPQTVKEIEINAFFMTTSLTSIEVNPRNMIFRDTEGVLHSRDGKRLMRYPQGKEGVNYYLEDSVEIIDVQAFSNVKKLETMTFTNSLKEIGTKAFEYCAQLETIILPSSVLTIGDRAFQYCEKLKSIMLSRSVKEIGDCAFLGCMSLETVSVPKMVTKIGNLAFSQCKNLKQIIIQDSVSFIGDGAFVGCEKICVSVKNNPYVEMYCRSHGIEYNTL